MRPEIIYTLDDSGQCRPEVLECLDIIAEAGDVVLGTGHLDKHEVEALIRAGRARGITRFCMTHVTLLEAEVEDLRKLCRDTGAVCEFLPLHLRAMGDSAAQTLREIGLEHVTLSTDSGFYLTPKPTVAYSHGIAVLLEAGLSEDEVMQVTHHTPARLLGVTQ